jgi:hypothetical protein
MIVSLENNRESTEVQLRVSRPHKGKILLCNAKKFMNDTLKKRGEQGRGLFEDSAGNSPRALRKPPVRWTGQRCTN